MTSGGAIYNQGMQWQVCTANICSQPCENHRTVKLVSVILREEYLGGKNSPVVLQKNDNWFAPS